MQDQPRSELNRRTMLKSLAALGAASASPMLFPRPVSAEIQPATTVRDRLWLWSHVEGSYNGQFNLPGKSKIGPADAAKYMGIPNVFMIHNEGLPKPPFDDYVRSFAALREVIWGIVGAGGKTNTEEREAVLELALRDPKISGVVMDDYFRSVGGKGPLAALTLDEVDSLKKRLRTPAKKLDLHVVLYEFQLNPAIIPHLKVCDVVQFWTWKGKNLDALEANMDKVAELAPDTRRSLGLYWWDFGPGKPLDMSLMKRQCELGLKWLREGRITSMIFCGSWLCDRKLETVEWTREWIRQVGNQTVPLPEASAAGRKQ